MSQSAPTSDRRNFLTASLTAAGGLALAACATDRKQTAGGGPLPNGATVLFQGDSITDAGRKRERAGEPNVQEALGNGYAWLAAAGLLASRPDADLKVLNRGISGNKVYQLNERWQQDCLDLKPDLLSILIGVNDIWHTKNGNYRGTVAIYERDYTALLQRTRAALPDVRLVVCEPFVLRCGAVDATWFPEFDEYRAAARNVADRFGAKFVAFQTMFDRACKLAPAEHWAKDGVHPSSAGAALMAQAWLDAVRS